MRKLYLYLLLSVSISSHAVTLNVTPAEKELILRAISVYTNLHAGNFRFENNVIKYNNKGATIKRVLVISKQRFRFVDKIVYNLPQVKAYLSITAGLSSVGVNSGLILWKGWGLSVSASNADNGQIRAGLCKFF